MQNNDAMMQLLQNRPSGSPDNKQTAANAASKKNDGGNIPSGRYTDEWLIQALQDAGVEVYGTATKRGITYHYVPCPNEAEHTESTNRSETAVYIFNGWPVFKCQHAHCTDWKFAEFAAAVGIQYQKGTDEAVPGSNGTNYYSDFYEYNKEGVPNKVIETKITSWICRNYTFFVLGDLPYFINDAGCYVLDDGGAEMKRIIQSCIVPRLCTSSAVNSVFRMILYQNKRKEYKELNQYPVEWVPFLNGFFVPDENKVMPILPEHFVINQIPHEFIPEAETACPVFDALLEYQLPDADEREQWLEYAGSCFNRDTSGQKWTIIKGGGGTGKSTELNVLIDCIGADNVSNETLQGLNERFNATALFGKMVNICADISSEDMKRIDVLKKITGEDRNGVKHEKKGKDSFFFTPFCKLLFSANEIPLNRDEKSNAFYRRLMITVMDRKPEHVDRNLQRKLKAEIDGIIHRYMDALKRFYERGGYYLESERSKQEVERLRRSADSVIAFFDDELVRDADGRIERGALYQSYKDYCEREERLYPVTRNKLFERFRDEGIQETKDGRGFRYFIGIRYQKDGFIELSDDEARDMPFA